MITLVVVGLMSLAQGAPLDNGLVAITADAVQPGNPDQTTSPPPSVQGRVRLDFGNRLGENPFGNVFTRSRSVEKVYQHDSSRQELGAQVRGWCAA